MPFGDGTGPTGMGPGSRRGAGFSGGFSAPGSLSRGAGFGRGGGGQGRRNRFRTTGSASWWRRWGWRRAFLPSGTPHVSTIKPEEELATLKSQADWLQSTLSQVRQKIEELETKAGQE